MGVFISSSSCFMISRRPGSGLLGSSDGRLAVLGVLRAGKAGLGDSGESAVGEVTVVLMVGGMGSGEVGAMMAVELDRTSCQTDDARDEQTAMPATGSWDSRDRSTGRKRLRGVRRLYGRRIEESRLERRE